MTKIATTDAALAAKITEAVKAVDTAIATQMERAKAAGLLLHVAQKRHPGRKAFEAFLKLTDGVQYSRAMELIAVATDRKTFEKLTADNAARQQNHRDKNKKKKAEVVRYVTDDSLDAAPKPKRLETVPESAEASAEKRKAEMTDLSPTPEARAAKASAQALDQFRVACQSWLPKITVEADRQKARDLVATLTCSKCREAA